MKRRGTLYNNFQLKKKNLGGLFGKKPEGNADSKTVAKVGTYAGAASGLINAIDPGDEDGVQSTAAAGLSGVASGVAAGAVLGPVGMVGMGVLGGVTSLISNRNKAAEAEQRQIKRNFQYNEKADKEVAAKIAIDPTLVGDTNATMYRRGGTLKGKPAGKFALQGTLAGQYRGIRSQVPSIAITPNRMMEDGGIIPVDIEGRAVIEGPSHEEGGVKVPELGVELEGGETLDGDFVFSKELGFADKHKKIMKAIKATEKDDSSVAKNTRKRLAEQEERLKAHQEMMKKEMGEENEIDNTAEEMKNINKSVSFKDQKNLKKKALGGRVTASIEGLDPVVPKLDLVAMYKDSLTKNMPTSLTPVSPIRDNTNVDVSTNSNETSTLEKVVPFVSNLANSFRKLPAVPEPILNNPTAPKYANYNASRSEAVRAVRSANKTAEAQLSSSNATAAVRAANLTQGIRAVNEVNQAEANTNMQIANRTTERNQEIERENNAKLEYANAQRVARSLKQQELNAENLANASDKFQLMTRDRNLRSLEDDKLMLQIAQDPTGASWRAGRDIFKRRLTPESFKALDEKMSKLMEMDAEERKAMMEALQKGVVSLGASDASTPSIIVNSSTSKKKKG